MSTIEQRAGRGPVTGCPVAHDFDPLSGTPQAFFAKARREQPVFYHEKLDAYVVTRYEDCDRVLRDSSGAVSATAALAPNVPPIPEALQILGEAGFVPKPSLVDEDGAGHRLHRQATQGPFRPAPVRALEDFVRRQVNERLDAIVKLGEADIVDAVIYEVPAATILHMMGVPDEEMGMIKHFRGPWAVFGWGYPSEDEQIETAKGMGSFQQWARRLAGERLANRGEDIISVAISNLEDKDALDMDWVNNYGLNIVMAGHETTTNTTAGGLISLLTYREQWEAICADPELITNAADEILRYDTGVPTWRQRAVEDLDVAGVTIPAGSKVYLALVSANRDEAIFGEDSEQFDVRREHAKKHIAFGSGAHTCMGNHLARLEIRVMLEELTRRLPHMEIVPGQKFQYSPNTSQRGPEHIVVRWDPSKNPIPADRP